MRKALIICLLIPLAVGGLAAWLTSGSMEQFSALAQPPFSPPGWVFPVAWTVLYLLMGAASWLVWKSGAPEVQKNRALALYGAQLAVNFVWPLLFFRAGWYGLAFFWLVLLLVLVIETTLAFGRIDKRAGWMLVPYLLWLVFAGYLNIGVWMLNG